MSNIKCPRCMSEQVTANKKGFSGGKALGGVLLTGGVGLLAGTIGSNKVLITCLSCGKEFKPGQGYVEPTDTDLMSTFISFLGFFGGFFLGFVFFQIYLEWWIIFSVPAAFCIGVVFMGIFLLSWEQRKFNREKQEIEKNKR
jgi:hypothetical protein